MFKYETGGHTRTHPHRELGSRARPGVSRLQYDHHPSVWWRLVNDRSVTLLTAGLAFQGMHHLLLALATSDRTIAGSQMARVRREGEYGGGFID